MALGPSKAVKAEHSSPPMGLGAAWLYNLSPSAAVNTSLQINFVEDNVRAALESS